MNGLFSNVIKERRLGKCMTQSELCVTLGMDEQNKSTVCKWENGSHEPTMRYAKKLAEVLGGEPNEYRFEVSTKDGK